MNLYEIKNVETGQIMATAIRTREAAKLLGCPTWTISGAYHSNYAIHGKYKVELADITIKKLDPLWIEWDTTRQWLMNICGKGKKNK